MDVKKGREAFWKAAYGPTPMLDGAVRFIEAGLLAAAPFLQEPCKACADRGAERKKKPSEIQCPICGYYCLGRGGVGCIDKPSLVQAAQERTAAAPKGHICVCPHCKSDRCPGAQGLECIDSDKVEQPAAPGLVERMLKAFNDLPISPALTSHQNALRHMTAAFEVATAHFEREKQQALAEQEERLLRELPPEEWNKFSHMGIMTRAELFAFLRSRRTAHRGKTDAEKVADLLANHMGHAAGMYSLPTIAAEICALLKEADTNAVDRKGY